MKKKKIKLLDMYCGAGGCSMGYYQACRDMNLEIEITGVDNKPQPNYPFKFVQGDAIEYLKKNHKKFTHVHASPPCQKYSKTTQQFRNKGKNYPDLIEVTRNEIKKTGLYGVIENVPQAPIKKDIVLRGDMFGLNVLRTRHFELVKWFAMSPVLPKKLGSVKEGNYCSVFGKASYRKSKDNYIKPTFQKKTIRETWSYAMGIDWYMKDTELSQAVPPAYTRYIGKYFFNYE